MLFLESPWPILIVGLVSGNGAGDRAVSHGPGRGAGAMGGVALLVLLGVLIERSTLTDTKRIRQTLEAAAAGLQANNAKQVDACIVPDADGDGARKLVDWALSHGRVPGTYDPQSRGEVQLPDESAHGGDDVHGLGPRQGPQRHGIPARSPGPWR